MKYLSQILIELPLEKVIEKFDDPDNMKHWQPGLLSFEHVSGEPGKPGAVSRLRYRMGKREIEMTETITLRDLPYRFDGTYEAKGVLNIIKNTFESVDGNRTRWTSENEFRLKGVMKLMGWLMPGAFKKQTQTYMTNFKEFAEKGTSLDNEDKR
jgi:hypothetical protein